MRSASVRAVARGTPRKSFHLSLLYTLPTQVTGHSWFEGLDWEALEKVESVVSVFVGQSTLQGWRGVVSGSTGDT